MAGTITALEIQKNKPQRVNVFLDGEFAFSLALVYAAQLKRGQYLSVEEIGILLAQDEREQAYDQSLHFLSYRPRSQTEVARYLSKKGWNEAVVNHAVDRLHRAGLLDDVAFAQFWVENRQRFRPRSRAALRYELQSKGVTGEIVSIVLANVDEEETAYNLAFRKVQKEPRPMSREAQRKLGQYLARQGFSFSVINNVLLRLEEEKE